MGHTPSTAGTFRKKFRKIPERPRKRSQSVSWNSAREYGWDAPKPYNSRHLRLPEHFLNSLPPSTAGHASFFVRSGSGEGLSEAVMEFPAVLGVFLKFGRAHAQGVVLPERAWRYLLEAPIPKDPNLENFHSCLERLKFSSFFA